MISEEFKDNNYNNRISVTDEMVEYYLQAKDDLCLRKSKRRGKLFLS